MASTHECIESICVLCIAIDIHSVNVCQMAQSNRIVMYLYSVYGGRSFLHKQTSPKHDGAVLAVGNRLRGYPT